MKKNGGHMMKPEEMVKMMGLNKPMSQKDMPMKSKQMSKGGNGKKR